MEEKYFYTWSTQKGKNHPEVTKAQDIYIWINGKKCYDMSSQAINVNIGHKNERIINAIKRQCEEMPFIGGGFKSDVRNKAANEIINVCPKGMEKVFFTSSGSEANENAIKMARQYTGKNKIFSAYNSYHGSFIGSGALTGDARRFYSEKGVSGFIKFKYPDKYHCSISFENDEAMSKFYLLELEEQIKGENPNDIAAIFIEPIIGGNGVIIPPDGFLQGIRELCDKYNILMICDEVMTGWGRTGKWFCIEHWGVTPDIITTSKGITSSYIAFGAVVVNKKISDYFDNNPLMCGATNYGHLLGCAATIANINEYKDRNLIENSRELGEVLRERLLNLKDKYDCIGDIRCKGLFACIEFAKNKETKEPNNDIENIIPLLIKNGLWTLSRRNIIMIAPPLIINQQELLDALEILEKTIKEYFQKISMKY